MVEQMARGVVEWAANALMWWAPVGCCGGMRSGGSGRIGVNKCGRRRVWGSEFGGVLCSEGGRCVMEWKAARSSGVGRGGVKWGRRDGDVGGLGLVVKLKGKAALMGRGGYGWEKRTGRHPDM